jgi:hypothetical protein
VPELLFFAQDHSSGHPAPTTTQLAGLPKLYDLITWQADGWNWGAEELNHAWFRIVVWGDPKHADLDTLLAPVRPSGGTYDPSRGTGIPKYLGQYRAFYLDLSSGNPHLPPSFGAWHADKTRKQPKFTIPHGAAMSVANSKAARAQVQNPAYLGGDRHIIG